MREVSCFFSARLSASFLRAVSSGDRMKQGREVTVSSCAVYMYLVRFFFWLADIYSVKKKPDCNLLLTESFFANSNMNHKPLNGCTTDEKERKSSVHSQLSPPRHYIVSNFLLHSHN